MSSSETFDDKYGNILYFSLSLYFTSYFSPNFSKLSYFAILWEPKVYKTCLLFFYKLHSYIPILYINLPFLQHPIFCIEKKTGPRYIAPSMRTKVSYLPYRFHVSLHSILYIHTHHQMNHSAIHSLLHFIVFIFSISIPYLTQLYTFLLNKIIKHYYI